MDMCDQSFYVFYYVMILLLFWGHEPCIGFFLRRFNTPDALMCYPGSIEKLKLLGATYLLTYLQSCGQEGAVTVRARSPKQPFHMCFARAVQRCIFWRFRSVSMARQPFRWSFRCISIFVSIHSIYFDFDSIEIDVFADLFRFNLIPTSKSPKHFDGVPAISIDSSRHSKNGAWWRLLPPHFCLFDSHYAGIWHIMSDMKIQSWKSGKTTINQWEGRVILRHAMKKRCGRVSAPSRLFWPFFLGTYCLLG